jgi:ParB-like chromosome segregation protein Spo0J
MEFKKIFLSELSPAGYNPRKNLQPGDPEFEKIRKSIEEFGYVEPIVVNADYTIISGHQRFKVLRELGIVSADVVVVDIDKAKEKALNLALNKITGDWDWEKLRVVIKELSDDGTDLAATGFDMDEISVILQDMAEPGFVSPREGMPDAQEGDGNIYHSYNKNPLAYVVYISFRTKELAEIFIQEHLDSDRKFTGEKYTMSFEI